MAFGRNNREVVLNEGFMQYGVWTNPETIGISGTNWETQFVGDDLGIIETGTAKGDVMRGLLELLSGTPQKLERKDLIRKQFVIEGNLMQLDLDTVALVTQGLKTAYVDAPYVADIVHIGTEEDICSTAVNGFLVTLKAQDCKPVYLGMWDSIITSETASLLATGNKYATLAMKAEARPHANFSQIYPETARNLGAWWKQQS